MVDEQIRAWTVEARTAALVAGPLPAQVPGSVHLDLIAAGVIDDLTVQGRDDEQSWVGETPWRYRTTIRHPPQPHERALLTFEGIDTIARVYVAGRLRLTASNMFRRHELDVTAELAAADEVEVIVDLDPALAVAGAAHQANPLPRAGEYGRPFNQVRKMACSFGWDWGPATVSAGLWRPVRLRTWSGARLVDVRVTARPGTGSPGVPSVAVQAAVEGRATALRVSVGDHVAQGVAASGRADVTVEVPGAGLWWPRTEGPRPLYEVTVTLLGEDDVELDRHVARVGFRTVEVVQQPDGDGQSFAVHLNGRRVWVRGVNWIPDDPFPARVTPQRYHERLAEAAAAGANAVRVWGGGIYEDDAFYDACDELGLLVIQDFLFACAAYPEDDETVEQVRAEVRDNVRRLRHRPSLALWCGNNENLWGHQDWGWVEELDGRPWGLRFYQEILPSILAEEDGTRPYVPGSPFSPADPDGTEHHPNDPCRGMQHIWDVWNTRDYADYEQWRPRFVSEFGYQAPASWPTLQAAVGDALDPADPALEHHQRAGDGAAKLRAGLDRHLPHPPAAGIAWYFATQLLQARALTTGVNHLRSLHDYCSGVIWWQLNDIWPAISWSVLDVRGRRKLAWHALRRAYDPRLVTITAGEGAGTGPHVVLVNDTAEVWGERLTVRWVFPGGAEVALEQHVQVPPHGSWAAPLGAVPPQALAAVADAGARRGTRWLPDDVTLDLPAPDLQVAVTSAPAEGPPASRLTVTVTAHVLVRDVALLAELAVPDAVVTGQLVTLLPGESADLVVQLPPGVDGAAIDWAGLIWSDNRLRQEAYTNHYSSTRTWTSHGPSRSVSPGA